MATYPEKYIQNNDRLTKFLNVVVEIEDCPFSFSLVQTFTKIRYGDPDLFYGLGGFVYGGLRPLGNVKPYLSMESNLKLSQKLEPEQGRASASTLSLTFVDVEGFMTRLFSPNQIMNEVLGGKQVKIWLGYAGSSFREDYYVVFRGYITGTKFMPTKVVVELTDAQTKNKQQSCFLGKGTVRSIVNTFPPSAVNDTTDVITINNHGYVNGFIVQFSSTGTLPAPLAPGTDYYIINATTNTFKLSATLNGGAINLLSQGTGTHTVALTDIGPFASRVPLDTTLGFSITILGPNGTYDTAFGTYVQVENESMQYQVPSQIGADYIDVIRGARGTTAASHAVTTDATNTVQLEGNIMDNALKLMLSGWGGPWISDVPIGGFGETFDPGLGILPKAIIMPEGGNAVEDLGLAVGDYIYVTGSTLNDGTYTVAGFGSANDFPNNVILTNEFVVPENPTTGTMALRSQYDTLPINCGSKLRMTDVDTANWQRTKRLFAFQPDCTFRNFIQDPISAKEFIEKEYLLPAGCYGVTRFGRISVSATKPPLAGTNLVILSKLNVINPQSIMVTRSTTMRTFWNEIQYYYDTDDSGNQTSVQVLLDSQSLSLTTISSVLPINANGLRTDLGAPGFINRRGSYLLKRYANGAVTIQLQTNWQAGSLIQVSDTVALYDQGGLQIANLATGKLDVGAQLYEVINWDLDIKSGTSNLTLLTQLGYQITDRFAGIGPSSKVGPNATVNRVLAKESYGGIFPNQEWKKYEPVLGDLLAIHSPDFSFYEERTLVGFDAVNPNVLIFEAFSQAPQENWIIELAQYPNTTDPDDQAKSKLIFTFIDPTVPVVSGTSDTVFDVSPSDAAKFTAGFSVVQIHNDDYTRESSESLVLTVVGTTITLETAIEFTPQAGDVAELIGFLDFSDSGSGGPYRIL